MANLRLGNRIFPICIDGVDDIFVDNQCVFYTVRRGEDLKKIGTKMTPFHFRGERIFGYEIYLRTFYGILDLPEDFLATGEPIYDMTFAKLEHPDPNTWLLNGTEFRRIPRYLKFFISDHGIVLKQNMDKRQRVVPAKLRKHGIDIEGYHCISLRPGYINGVNSGKNERIHRLVYETWVADGDMPSDMVIHHKDSIVWHNYPSNLEMVTNAENVRYATDEGVLRHTSQVYMSTEKMHMLCQMMTANKSPYEIARAFNIDPHSTDENELYNYGRICCYIRDVKKRFYGKAWQNVVNQYDLGWYDHRDEMPTLDSHWKRVARLGYGGSSIDEMTIRRMRKDRANGASIEELRIKYHSGKATIHKYTDDCVNANLASTTIERVAS